MSNPAYTVGIYTLGCKVNQYESEAIAERFTAEGFCVQAPTLPCDIYIINTCTVTAESDRKARQLIRRAIHQNPNAHILVTGCLSQTQPEQIASIKGVEYICGNSEKLAVVDAAKDLISSAVPRERPLISVAAPDVCGFEPMRISRFDRTRAYVKIEDGCESHCTYCIIPSARGKIRSKDPSEVLTEVQTLTAHGCREIVLTGIETASYGKDLDSCDLADLLLALDRIPGIGRIRLGSLDPSLMKEDFVNRIAAVRSLAPHFHLSMQSGSDHILALMKRKYNRRMALEGMQRLRRAIPHVQFTTDMIVGFPQESEEDFLQTMQFVREARFLAIHVFPYSKRRGTPAASMPGQIPETIKHQRVQLLTEMQNDIQRKLLQTYIGQTEDVLFETYKNGMAYGHTANFIEVACPAKHALHATVLPVHIERVDGSICFGRADAQTDPSGKESQT